MNNNKHPLRKLFELTWIILLFMDFIKNNRK